MRAELKQLLEPIPMQKPENANDIIDKWHAHLCDRLRQFSAHQMVVLADYEELGELQQNAESSQKDALEHEMWTIEKQAEKCEFLIHQFEALQARNIELELPSIDSVKYLGDETVFNMASNIIWKANNLLLQRGDAMKREPTKGDKTVRPRVANGSNGGVRTGTNKLFPRPPQPPPY